MITNHQFKKKEFYLPNWEVEYLFIGTFNPSGGEKVPYYYGRKKNRFWELLPAVQEKEMGSIIFRLSYHKEAERGHVY